MNGWTTVTKKSPCPICNHGDWCGVHTDGTVRCMRVQSDKESNGGWIHKPSNDKPYVAPRAPYPKPRYETPGFDCALWYATARRIVTAATLQPWADKLGLPLDAMQWLGACTVGGMLSFPMHDGYGNVCGIRTRRADGSKMAVKGSKSGVFLAGAPGDDDVVICEGPTDACAALALGFEPIGRPSCVGCEHHVVDTCKRLKRQRVTLCADYDGPGIAGAKHLAMTLHGAGIAVRMVAPRGHKDLRDWWRAGATRADVEAAWAQAKWS